MTTYDLITSEARKQEGTITEQALSLTSSRDLLANATDPVDAEEAALAYMHTLSTLRDACSTAIESIAHELLARRVQQQIIADSAGVHRVTVARWNRVLREQRQASKPQTETLFSDERTGGTDQA